MKTAGLVALFLDFDGTLAEFCLRPEEVSLARATHLALARLAANARFRVCVISGRRRADVQCRTKIAGVHYLGLHGWENGAPPHLDRDTRLLMDRMRQTLALNIRDLPAIRLEDKGAALSVHYRGAPEAQVPEARTVVHAALAAASPMRLFHGHKVWEILPRSIGDKGAAVQRQLQLLPPNALPLYVGDDRADEPAFQALPHGITVRVGRRSLTR